MSIITLTTDYGLKDHYVGALKGKILTAFREACIIDISHKIEPFNILQACYILESAYPSFPEKTIHLIGIDSESNKETTLVCIEFNKHYFLAADNGILSLLTENSEPNSIVLLNKIKPENTTDIEILISAATFLAKGGKITDLGDDKPNLKPLKRLKPMITNNNSSIRGTIIYVDHYGNLITNITKELFLSVGNNRKFEIPIKKVNDYRTFDITIAKQKDYIRKIFNKYSDITTNNNFDLKNYEGEKLAMFNEAGYLEIAIFRSNRNTVGTAESLLGLTINDTIIIDFL